MLVTSTEIGFFGAASNGAFGLAVTTDDIVTVVVGVALIAAVVKFDEVAEDVFLTSIATAEGAAAAP